MSARLVLSVFLVLTCLLGIAKAQGEDIICASIGATAYFVYSVGSCICAAGPTLSDPGQDCPTDPHGQAGCHGSCGVDCTGAGGGSCYIACNQGYILVNNVCVSNGQPSARAVPPRAIRDADIRAALRALDRRGSEEAGGTVYNGITVQAVNSDDILCPNGLFACALGGTHQFECVDVEADLRSCGGCVGEGLPGVDCLALPGVRDVTCIRGKCVT